jgi:hypothetical protein
MANEMAREDLLFYQQGDFRDLLETLKAGLRAEIDGQSRDYLLNTPEQDLCNYLTGRHSLSVPVLYDDRKAAHPAEDVDIDVRGRFDYAIIDDDEPHIVKGTSITVAIPFDGDGQLFHFRPSSYSLIGIRGRVVGNEIHLTYSGLPQDMSSEKIKNDMDREITRIKEYLKSMANDAEAHNKLIESEARKLVTVRKEIILKDEVLVGGLGIPIKRKEDATTYTIPVVRKKPLIDRSKALPSSAMREPVLHESEYNHILELISRMALVMERSPKAFQAMDEESLRWQFLVPLNSHYEGMATGETFNYTGKTDILIRYEDKNVFIAECKIWYGPKGLQETIDQLLGYTSWRDTKTAIILFNKNEKFSAVLSQIPNVVSKHSCFKRDLGKQGETNFKYLFHQPSDSNRDVILTVLAFNVPK